VKGQPGAINDTRRDVAFRIFHLVRHFDSRCMAARKSEWPGKLEKLRKELTHVKAVGLDVRIHIRARGASITLAH
jgi:hypothetical protein